MRRPIALAAVAAALLAGTGCSYVFGETPVDNISSLSFRNSRSETVIVSYELKPEQVDPTYSGPRVLTLPPGDTDSLTPFPAPDFCLVAPIVIRSQDGTELERVPEGYCWDGSPRYDRSFFDIE
ncbi:hypothetical protein PO878_18915 [Iamia majanohamensis]|uniref:Lipoprotein n=1 Tax=Iamia majanohamensis TaxID=467976 RepID=A0AAE9Y528_9ACTN|nr:hypothetical protein [Iamia majanohamensis]WCO66574.1 hypothetical protein PO878_18915 [Iamia majanohamensis]